MSSQLVEDIDSLLPQTQCTRCGYPTCRAYAEAVAGGQADINRCPPGGQMGVRKLALLLGREEKSLDPQCGEEQPRAAALIDEARCIGCTLCIQACPVDAIVGAAKRMHTVLTAYCTGCELCLPPCPVDCIDMIGLDELITAGHNDALALARQSTDEMAAIARARFAHHERRRLAEVQQREQRFARKAASMRSSSKPESKSLLTDRKQDIIEAALRRARARRAQADRRGKSQ